MEIEIGDYIRTDKGNIGKIVEIRIGKNKDTKNYMNIYMLDNKLWTITDYIVKHSKNIIDVVEVGDYVNGSKLLSIDYAEDREGNCDKLHYYYSFEDSEKDINEYYEELNIKSIVTKEQMANIEYKI